ncbi:hypothetical protein BDV93DRAFT_17895 [Ceratobasidium sp. AG-I]|nr:hypothetical protein BDV93DRAFT_17895 [Ceratobasidium sp. AG-I]
MAPIPIRPTKGPNPLPLQSTLKDLSALRARNSDMLALLDNSISTAKLSNEIEESLEHSYDFVKSTRRALDVDANVNVQGERVDAVRGTLQEIEAGFS